MPAVAARSGPGLKDYGWMVLVFAAFIAAWLTLPFLSGTGSGSVSIDEALSGGEQSLHSLEDSPSPVGALAPGARAGRKARELPDGAGSLYQSGAPMGDAAGGSISSQLAAALRGVSKSSPPPAAAAPAARRSGSAPAGGPRAEFAAPGQTASPGSSSGASMTLVEKPFGSGGDPGLHETAASFPSGGVAAANGLAASESFASLNRAKESSQSALTSHDEMAVASAKKTFDFAQTRAQTLTGGGDSAPGGPPSMDGSTPASLKGGDPSLGHKELTPPPVGPASETKDKDNAQYMRQQMIMMMIMMAIGGIAGSAFSAVGNSLAKNMGLSAPTNPQTGSGLSGQKPPAG